ncbi:hypothetical protein KJ966_03615 [bacterium]|nr:hypothetical protein [bacterium]
MTNTCECFEKCDLFDCATAKLPSTAKSFQDKYCRNDHGNCARYMIFKKLGRDFVPADLFPNERGRALTILDAT